jgi:hypothetical protein
MKKSERIQTMVEALGQAAEGLDPCYAGWFSCFNRKEYYEAHDVLEHLWLQTDDANHAFYKGLIQLAGAFVHLKKQYERPWHTKDGARLRPASRLFRLARGNLESYRPTHLRLDVSAICRMCDAHTEQLENSGFSKNPWAPAWAPRIGMMLPHAENAT